MKYNVLLLYKEKRWFYMKKMLKFIMLGIFVLLFTGGKTASADELVRATPRATPMIKEVTLASGESEKISFFVINNEKYCTSFVAKVATKSGEKESYKYRVPFPQNNGIYLEHITYNSGGYTLSNSNHVLGDFIGFLEYEITNYSAAPITYIFGVNSVIYEKGVSKTTYRELDFQVGKPIVWRRLFMCSL